MQLIQTVSNQISMLPLPNRLLLAISGGIDSMVLLDVFIKLKHPIEVAHVNYGFREQAHEEEALVRKVCIAHNIPIHVLQLNGYDDLNNSDTSNLQAYAREKRYEFFNGIVENRNLNYIVTAHHALDNIETVFMNILHSTSYKGLRGMQIIEDNIFRPLLDVRKNIIEDYATKYNIAFFNDESNNQSVYKRNFIRNEVLPLIEQQIPSVKKNLQSNINKWKGVVLFYEKMVLNYVHNAIKKTDDIAINYFQIKKVIKSPYAEDLALALLNKYNFTPHQIPELFKLFDAQNGAILENDKFQFIKNNDTITIIDISLKPQKGIKLFQEFPINELIQGKTIIHGDFTFKINVFEINEHSELHHNEKNFYVDIDSFDRNDIVLVRHNISGDYFYPFGLNKKKKLSKFFIDKKIKLHLRNQQIVIKCKDYILCLVGHTIDHRFRITEKTKSVLHISVD